uniref:Si:dkey-148a17.6 n=1 Tax=Callorhinchus milii TaxID=7868 RepID=A0A4W3K2S2_CALMI
MAPSMPDAGITASLVLGSAFLIGVPGNFLVIWIILCTMRQRSPTVVLILNLAVADFLVLITLPLWIYAFLNSWDFGQAMCKIISYIVCCNMYISVFLIMMMSIDRFLAVLYPFVIQKWRKNHVVVKTVLVVWILAFLFSIPILLVQEIDTDPSGNQQCFYRNYSSDGQQKIICLGLETSVGFAIPFTVLTVCYMCVGKRVKQMTYKKKNQTSMLIARIVIVFVVCWFPYHLFNLLEIASILIETTEVSTRFKHISDTGSYLSGALAFISSSINPLLYAFAARNFRQGFLSSKLAKVFEQMIENTKEESTKEDINMLQKESGSLVNDLESQMFL